MNSLPIMHWGISMSRRSRCVSQHWRSLAKDSGYGPSPFLPAAALEHTPHNKGLQKLWNVRPLLQDNGLL